MLFLLIIEGKDGSFEDELSSMSLSDRVRLFNERIKLEKKVPVVLGPPPARKRSSRFKTQPVTTEEVETAAKRISPLAASFVRPPDAEVLGNYFHFMP